MHSLQPSSMPRRAPSARAALPARLPARPLAVSQRPAAGVPGRVAAPNYARAQRLPVPYRGLAGHVEALCRDTVQQPTAPAVTIQNPVLQYNFFFFPTNYTPLQYNLRYCNNFQPSSLLFCNTKIVLQYNFQHPLNLQYT